MPGTELNLNCKQQIIFSMGMSQILHSTYQYKKVIHVDLNTNLTGYPVSTSPFPSLSILNDKKSREMECILKVLSWKEERSH